MYKVAFFRGEADHEPVVLPLHSRSDAVFEKVAAPTLLDDVSRYIASLRPRNDAKYVLVNALGAGEYFGSNINGDLFPEAALIHRPDEWTGNPVVDRIRAKDWAYGFPTFYFAHPYAHHRNKDATRAFGEVELAAWNAHMRRVELVVRVEKDKCEKFGGVQVWDKLSQGEFPDVSMGCKVPFDTCSICLDWKTYRNAQATFDRAKHKSVGDAVLQAHRALQARGEKGIRGLSITRKDYCDHALKAMNKILPDGRKVFVYNDYPKFFDISFVFVGADKTAKVMLKIAEDSRVWSMPSTKLAAHLGYDEELEVIAPAFEKAASHEEALREVLLGKVAKQKAGEIVKDLPAHFARKAIPLLTRSEPDVPDDLLNLLGERSQSSLATAAGLGIVLRPREFQRITLVSLGRRDIADDFDRDGVVFPQRQEEEDPKRERLSTSSFDAALARLLLPLFLARSALAPAIEQRVVVLSSTANEPRKGRSSLSSDLLHKIGSAYSEYRRDVMDLVASAQDLLSSAAHPSEEYFHKLAQADAAHVFTALSAEYLKHAFWDEVGRETKTALANVERGLPSRNTFTTTTRISGGQKS